MEDLSGHCGNILTLFRGPQLNSRETHGGPIRSDATSGGGRPSMEGGALNIGRRPGQHRLPEGFCKVQRPDAQRRPKRFSIMENAPRPCGNFQTF